MRKRIRSLAEEPLKLSVFFSGFLWKCQSCDLLQPLRNMDSRREKCIKMNLKLPMLCSGIDGIFKNVLISVSMTTISLEMEGHKAII